MQKQKSLLTDWKRRLICILERKVEIMLKGITKYYGWIKHEGYGSVEKLGSGNGSIFHHLVYLETWNMIFVGFLECIHAC